MTDTALLTQQLAEAKAALHALNTGQQVASVDYDGRKVAYSAITIADLRAHIRTLETALGIGTRRRAIGARF